MTSILNKAEITRQSTFALFPWGYKNVVSYTADIEPFQLTELADLILNAKFLLDLISNKQLSNLKGRGEKQFLLIEGSDIIENNELLSITGKIIDPNEDEIEPFKANITTPYSKSEANKIYHQVTYNPAVNLPQNILLQEIPKLIPVTLDYFRFGLVKYKSRLVSGMFGFLPVCNGHLILDCNTKQFKMEIMEEGLASKEASPWGDDEIFKNLTGILQCG